MQLLWEHREGQLAESTLYHYFDGMVGHYMAFNQTGDMVFHRMVNNDDPEGGSAMQQELAASRLISLSHNAAFKPVPPVFKGAPVPELAENPNCVQITQDLCICYNSGNQIPLAIPLIVMAQQRRGLFENYVLTFVQDNIALVAAFSGEQLLLLNAFPVANEAEALYFTLAPVKKAGVNLQTLRVELLAEEHATHSLLELFRRFVNNVGVCPANLPYSLDQLPPNAHVAALLHLMPQCALPEEI